MVTDRTREVLDIYLRGYREGMTSKEMAKQAGVSLRIFQRHLEHARDAGLEVPKNTMHDKKERRLAIPEVGQRPDMEIYAASTLVKRVDDNGSVVLEWLKQRKNTNSDAWHKAVDEYISGKLKPIKPLPSPAKAVKDLLNLYVITDFHMGMLSFAPETGGDWDTNIAKNVLLNAIQEMADRSPDAEEGLFCELGDFLHFDSLEAITPTSGHLLDADTRYDRLVDITLTTSAKCIEILAKKHKKLTVIIAEGNHDMAGSVWLRKCMKQIFKNDKRIIIDDTPFPYYAHHHGNNMLGFHHGHKVKNKSLPALFASEPRYRSMWGDAKYTYIHTGHTHQKEQDSSEHGGAIVERHPTLAERDAYAARGGWVSKRAAQQITYHKDKGEIGRILVYPDMRDYV